jgi:hypothetical protein
MLRKIPELRGEDKG